MIEILARDGLAREARWTCDGLSAVTPNILFLRSGGLPLFERGECYLSAGGPVGGRFTLSSGGSWFLEREASGPAPAIPAFPNVPSGLEARPGESFEAALEGFRRSGGPVLPVPGEFPERIEEALSELLLFPGALGGTLRPRGLAADLVRLKQAAGFGRLVYAPGLGDPAHIALLAYCGVDLLDSAPLLAAARLGVRLFPGWKAHAAEEGLCHCPACEGGALGPEAVYLHNCFAALSEVRTVRAAVRRGRLRELVEGRLSEAWQVSLLRHLDLHHHDFCERYFPVARPAAAGLDALGLASLSRPEVVRFRRRVLERYRRPPSSPVLLLLPCSARKPYSDSLSHRAFRAATDRAGNPGAVHEAVVTSPLGIVPLELDSIYPAGSYDVPVTGDWDETERRMVSGQLEHFVRRGGYSAVVCHLPGMDFLAGALPPGTVFTAGRRATSPASLSALSRALRPLSNENGRVGRREASRERFASLARFQFGPGGEALAERCEVRRRGIDLRVTDGQRTQLALLGRERGLLSLTMEGARRLLGRTAYEVEIGDFRPSGTVFAPGVVRAGADIRPGDEVLVTRGGELRGVGVALMSAAEMERAGRGGAVRMRHHVSTRGGGG
ncbi:MAG: hypothetical protein FJ149_00220 [Euryarchaeota archaeon]|nr:hypothetical protein [Euryarchaeota archaeon]